jgi:SAM-dependent methyltransferase
MRATGCPLCSGKRASRVVQTDYNLTGKTTRPWRVGECRGCALRYLDPAPGEEELAACYGEDYPAWSFGEPAEPGSKRHARREAARRSLERRFARIAQHRLALVRRLAPAWPTPLRVLDVGCGTGAFLRTLSRVPGVEAWGQDVSPAGLRALAAGGAPCRLVGGRLAEADLPRNYFDLITLWHSLEHDGRPAELLRCVKGLLRPGGRAVAEVPHSTGGIARLCGACWLGWDLPRHLVHFSPVTLRRVARRAGFVEVRVLPRYTLNPLTLSPLLASLALAWWRRRGRRRKDVAYHQWDGVRGALLGLVHGLERALGGNGLLLVARAPAEVSSPCATSCG